MCTLQDRLGQREAPWEIPACVYHPDAALPGHLWETSGTGEVKAKQRSPASQSYGVSSGLVWM